MHRLSIAIILSIVLCTTGFEQPLFSQQLLPFIWERQEPVPAPDLSALKIVVVAGEDGVNIVKRKTAVQPVVEVRDKNNVPVSGIIVNFTTPNEGASAVFSNGSRTLSLVTDSTGRVTVTGMHPVSGGAFHITVTASVQGNVVATATIAQVNFLTAAAAAAAGGAAAGTGTAAGVSAGVIGGIVGGVAAAAAITAVIVTHLGSSKPAATIGVASGTSTVGAPH